MHLHELGVHRRRRRRDARVPARADRRRASRDRRRVHAPTARPPTSARRTRSPSRRSSRARTSARSSTRGGSSPTPGSRSRSSAARAGASSRSSTGPGVVRLGRVDRRGARAALPRRRGRSSTRRGSRASGCRSPRRWRAARRSSPRRTRRSTRRAATPPSAPTRRAPRRSRPASARRSSARDELRVKGLRARGGLLVAAQRRAPPRGVPAILVAIDTTPLAQTRAGTARYLSRPARPPRRAPCRRLSYPATSRAAQRRGRRALVPAARADGARRPPLPELPRPVLVAGAARRHRPRRRRAPPARSGSTAGRGRTRATPCRGSCAPRRG